MYLKKPQTKTTGKKIPKKQQPTKNFIIFCESFDLLFMYIFQSQPCTVYAPS